MSNNCCTTAIAEGGTLLDARIIGSELVAPVITGGMEIDDATAQALSTRLCNLLSACIANAVNNGTFDSVTISHAELEMAHLVSATLSGATTLDAAATNSIVDAVGPLLTEHVLRIVADNRIDNAGLHNVSLSGGITLDNAVSQQIADEIGPLLQEHIIAAIKKNGLDNISLRNVDIRNIRLSGTIELVEAAKTLLHAALSSAIETQVSTLIATALADWSIAGNTFTNISGTNLSASNTTLSGTTTITGQIPLDTAAHDHLVMQLRDSVRTIAENMLASSKGDIAAVFQDCDGAPLAPGVRLPSCQDMTNAINSALEQLPALDVISGFEYDEASHTLTMSTQLNNDGGPQTWTVSLDSLGGQTVTDGVTIRGTGVTGDPLKLIVTETTTIKAVTEGQELPTAIHGGRSALLGQPDKWVGIGGYLIPAFNKP
ncbi:hypothetical protein QFW19_004228 [Escherichia coli]|nr:hypothetical protein [Escherichia coli]